MTKLTLAETRQAFDGRISIMGGFPSVALVKHAMSDRQFDDYLDEFFRQIGRGDHLILGISDTTPPGADFQRLLRIRDRVEALGRWHDGNSPLDCGDSSPFFVGQTSPHS